MQRRNQRLLVGALAAPRAECPRRAAACSQSRSSDVDGFFFSPGTSRRLKNTSSASREQRLLEAGEMHVDDPRHRLAVGEADVVEEAAAQERVRQLLLVVRRDDDERPVLRARSSAASRRRRTPSGRARASRSFGNSMSALSISSISTTAGVVALERVPQHAALDVVRDVADVLVAELRIAQPRHRVVFVEALLRLRSST